MQNNKIVETFSYLFMFVMIVGCFSLKLMTTLISGITLYLIVTHFYKLLAPKMKSGVAHNLTLIALIALTVLFLGGITFGAYSAVKAGNGNLQNIGQDAFKILQEIRSYLPATITTYIPDDFIELKEKALLTFKANSSHIFEVTTHSLKGFVHIIIGLFLGAIVAFSFLHNDDIKESSESSNKPLRRELVARISKFTQVFSKVMSAQVKISAINTVLTGIYLLLVLPMFDVKLPYGKTLVLLTFLFGLIPVLGNLITNTLIFLISLTVSFKVAIASIVFLVVVHKLEYYINAKIVGEKIKTSIWELLIAMIIMETLFGVMGVVLAPVIYGYIKEELKYKNMI